MEVSNPFIATKQLSIMYSNICLYSSLASLLFILFPKYLQVCSATMALLCAIYCSNHSERDLSTPAFMLLMTNPSSKITSEF